MQRSVFFILFFCRSLDKAEVALNDRGHIELRDVVGTSQPHIAAVGDMTADMSLVNVAEIEARYAGIEPFFRCRAYLCSTFSVCSTSIFLSCQTTAAFSRRSRPLQGDRRVDDYVS